ncbi:MAG: glycosyltransferase family 4 protein [Acidobacteria bacterium]|nr:glycosyltransferase family 4 protein [Acidobacteriota bacterium]
MKTKTGSGLVRIGVLDHTGPSLGGGTMVAARVAWLLSELYSVELIRDWSGFNVAQVSAAFSLDLAAVGCRGLVDIWESFAIPSRYSFRRQLQRSRELTGEYDLFIYAGHWIPPFCYGQHGLIYCHFPIDVPLDEQLLLSDERWKKRPSADRWLRTQAYRLAWRACLSGYDHILANSAFTAHWMKQRWQIPADVLYPPIALEVGDSKKHNRIVSVGRFVSDQRSSKGQLEQVAAFRDFLERAQAPWELWLIGSCYAEHDRAYLRAVEQAASQLPIRFLINPERDQVLEVLRGGKIFWHTGGLYENQTADPVFSEHFGMATVEAMRAGCIPVVISSGGQREIIQHGINGFLSSNMEELVSNTVALAEQSSRLAELAKRAVERSDQFHARVFDRRILELVETMVHRRPRHRGRRRLLKLLGSSPASARDQAGEDSTREILSDSQDPSRPRR